MWVVVQQLFQKRMSFAMLPALCLAAACGSQHVNERTIVPPAGLDATPVIASIAPLRQPVQQLTLAQIKRAMQAGYMTLDPTLWIESLADCSCAEALQARLLFDSLQARGVLHQALMPTVRSEIRKDPQLLDLLSLPQGIQDVVREIFANDAEISKKIQSTIIEHLMPIFGGGTTPTVNFMFDGMPALIPPRQASFLDHPAAFSVEDQARRWRLIFQRLRSKKDPPTPEVIVSAVKALAEWKYLFGLDEDEAGYPYGGLTISTDSGDSSVLRPFDPRGDSQYVGFLTGAYEVYYPVGDSIDLAINIREVWLHRPGPVRLGEQAQLWEAAAEAYLALRPAARAGWDQSSGSALGPIPANAHELPLLFLKSLGRLLDGPFIDAERRLIRAEAKLASGVFNDQAAGARDLSRLARALAKWIMALSSVEEDLTNADYAAEAVAGRERLKNPLRLALQRLFVLEWDSVSLDERLEALVAVALVAEHVLESRAITAWLSERIPAELDLLLQQINQGNKVATDMRSAIFWGAGLCELSHKLFPVEERDICVDLHAKISDAASQLTTARLVGEP